MRLSRRVQLSPDVIDSSLQRLNCVSQNIIEIDIHPTVLSLFTSVAPDEVRRVVVELPLHEVEDASKEMSVDFSGVGMNTALALSLHTILLSRNCITTTLGLVQFKNVVRLSLLGNKIQRIEDCEALSLLPALQFLSLEFNPVTSLPHYRAHILRICAWPGTLNPKNCRLRKLDAQSVFSVEVERAAQCLQREKVTMGELVHRMRFLALLTEAEKRIALHHEFRRRGVIHQDTLLSLTVENVVTRCSAQMLARIDVSAASHLARRLMNGKCRLCAIVPQNHHADSVSAETEVSQMTNSPSDSLSSSNTMLLQNPYQAGLKIFCKDWSRDVFRRAMTSLDHRICGLLLSIAHALGEELTVVDVDHLNKLWFTQVAKADKCNFYRRQDPKSSIVVNGNSTTLDKKGGMPFRDRTGIRKSAQEEVVCIEASPSETPQEDESDNEDLSLCNISSITQHLPQTATPIATINSQQSSCDALNYSSQVQNEADAAQPGDDCNRVLINPIKVEESRNESDGVSVELPLVAPVPFPPLQNDVVLQQELLDNLKCHVRRRVFCRWQAKAWRRRQDSLCNIFLQKRLEELVQRPFPTPYAIARVLLLLPRTERKRVLFRFWREQAQMSYAPRSFRLVQLFTRWRWRTYQHRIIADLAEKRRVQTLAALWSRWRAVLHRRLAVPPNRLRNGKNSADAVSNGVSGFQPPIRETHGSIIVPPDTPSKKTQKSPIYNDFSLLRTATEATQGLTCSTKLSLDTAENVPRLLRSESTPTLFGRLSLPLLTPIMEASPSSKFPCTCERGTQTSAPSSYDDLAKDYKDAVRSEAVKEAEAMRADRLRLVDRLIVLEQRVNEGLVGVQHRDEEIERLRQKLTAMTLREECMKSTLDDYQREMEHLRAVIQALREERRELLRPILE